MLRMGRTGGADKFRSSARKDFFNSIDQQPTFEMKEAAN
jgi:hypothetical protein